jgi:hypothetical protein
VAGKRGKLSASVVGGSSPAFDGSNPRFVVLGQGREGLNEGVARLSTELGNDWHCDEKAGVALSVQEKSQKSVPLVAFQGYECRGDEEQVRGDQIGWRQLVLGDCDYGFAGVTQFPFLASASSLNRLLQGDVTFSASLVPVFVWPSAETVLSAPLGVVLNRFQAQCLKVFGQVSVTNYQRCRGVVLLMEGHECVVPWGWPLTFSLPMEKGQFRN